MVWLRHYAFLGPHGNKIPQPPVTFEWYDQVFLRDDRMFIRGPNRPGWKMLWVLCTPSFSELYPVIATGRLFQDET
jgi:hypothetical protein